MTHFYVTVFILVLGCFLHYNGLFLFLEVLHCNFIISNKIIISCAIIFNAFHDND